MQETNNVHPAPFPVALIDRIIGGTTANVVLDPFMGSGTTAVSAIKNNRHYIGIELSRSYCDAAESRIKAYKGETIVSSVHDIEPTLFTHNE